MAASDRRFPSRPRRTRCQTCIRSGGRCPRFRSRAGYGNQCWRESGGGRRPKQVRRCRRTAPVHSERGRHPPAMVQPGAQTTATAVLPQIDAGFRRPGVGCAAAQLSGVGIAHDLAIAFHDQVRMRVQCVLIRWRKSSSVGTSYSNVMAVSMT